MAKQITDNKNIIDNEALLVEKEKEYDHTDNFLGMTCLTMTNYISSSRSIMFTSHLKQFVVLNKPEFPRVFTNYENVFGKYSSSIYNSDDDYEVVKKIEKFDDKPGHLYILFLYNRKKKKYSVIQKRIAEELTEKYGYSFNNEKLDSLDIGDKVRKDETLWKSTSYDEDNNYCYGVNATVCYLIDNETIEDAVVVSKSFADKMGSKRVETVKVSINDNDILCNLYGTTKEYKGFPNIGEKIKNKILCVKRRIINDQLLYDLKKSNLMESSPFNDKHYYSNGRVIDVEIYCNRPLEELETAEYNTQFIKYLENQTRYYQEIYDFTSQIIESGCEYCDDIGFLHSRSKNILDPNFKWKDQENVFSNIILEITVEQEVGLGTGYKITGRYGNKGVISKVLGSDSKVIEDTDMPYFIQADGTRKYVDVIFNTLGVINRLNSAQMFEVSINFIGDNLVQKFKSMDDNDEKAKMLFKFLYHFNEGGMATNLEAYYKGLTERGKNQFFKDIDKNGIYVNVPPMWESEPMFDKLTKIYDEFPWIKPYQCYVKKWGREIPIMEKLVIGEEYVIKLKQTSKKNFSARSTGYLSQKGLPDKTSKLKNNQQLYSTTPIKLGRDENNNLNIGISSKILAKMHLFYRSSPVARRAIGKLYTDDILNFEKFKIKKGYKNRNIEILMAYLKSMGYTIDFGNTGMYCLDCSDDSEIKTYTFKDKTYVMTEREMRDFLLDQKLRYDYKRENQFILGTDEEVEKAFQKYKAKKIAELKGIALLDYEK